MQLRRSLLLSSVVASALAAFASACSDHTATEPSSHLKPVVSAKDVAPGSAGVLILASTVVGGITNGLNSPEAKAAASLGFPVTLATAAQWDAMTAADFQKYRAIVMGDPSCSVGTADLSAAEANAHVWGPVVNGNVFIIGSDPVFHGRFNPGAAQVTPNAIKFATSAEGQTGAYIALSCDYVINQSPVAVNVLAGLSPLGGFKAMEAQNCYNSAHIVATSDALNGLTDAALSNWSCSVHEIFTQWPSDFDVLAIAKGLGGVYTASDGSVGTPYILARGKGLVVISDVSLTPATDNKNINTSETLTATVKANGAAVGGTQVTFTIVDGPNAGKTSTATTDANGSASFSYTSTLEGTDGVRASYVDAVGHTQTSGRSAITWAKPADVTPPVVTHTITGGTANAAGWYSSDVTVTFSATDAESPITTKTGCDSYPVTANTTAAGTTFICTATSTGGTAADTVTIKLDKTVPVVTGTVSGTLSATGWYTSPVSVSWSTSAAGPSGITANCPVQQQMTDTKGVTFTCDAVTGAGLKGTGTVTFKLDASPPVVSPVVSGTLGNAGWYTSNVTVIWNESDDISGIASALCTASTLSSDNAGTTYSCTATNGAGLQTTSKQTVKRDATAPVIGYSNNVGPYTVDQTINITCSASDAMSGLASTTCANIVGDAYTFTLGTHAYSANAADVAGNTNSATTSFNVLVTQGSVCALVGRWVSNAGNVNSLCVKVNHGDYEPFRNELAALNGKKIASDKAAILLNLVNALAQQ